MIFLLLALRGGFRALSCLSRGAELLSCSQLRVQ